MKSFSTIALAGIIGFASLGEAKMMHTGHDHQFAIDQVRETREHLELIFGKGLIGLYKEDTGQLDMKRMAMARRMPYQASGKFVGGVYIDQEKTDTFMFGMAQGLQYTGMSNKNLKGIGNDLLQSNCFYALVGLSESAQRLQKDFSDIFDPAGEFKWFNLIGYNPLQIFNRVAVGYEMCDVYTQFERFSGLLSGDWAMIADTVGQDAVYFGTEFMKDSSKFTKIVSCKGIDDAIAAVKDLKNQGEDLASKAVDAAKGAVVKGAKSAIEARTMLKTDDDWDNWDKKKSAVTSAATAAGQKALDTIKNAASNLDCKVNMFEAGIEVGKIMSRVMKQKLDESKV